jgi:hypothetical protein
VRLLGLDSLVLMSPNFFLLGDYGLYEYRIPMHPKHGPPLLYYPGVVPIVLPCELAFGSNKFDKF